MDSEASFTPGPGQDMLDDDVYEKKARENDNNLTPAVFIISRC